MRLVIGKDGATRQDFGQETNSRQTKARENDRSERIDSLHRAFGNSAEFRRVTTSLELGLAQRLACAL